MSFLYIEGDIHGAKARLLSRVKMFEKASCELKTGLLCEGAKRSQTKRFYEYERIILKEVILKFLLYWMTLMFETWVEAQRRRHTQNKDGTVLWHCRHPQTHPQNRHRHEHRHGHSQGGTDVWIVDTDDGQLKRSRCSRPPMEPSGNHLQRLKRFWERAFDMINDNEWGIWFRNDQ